MPKFTKPRSLDIEPEAYYQITKVASFLDISVATLKREIERDKITAKAVGKVITTIKGSEILRYLKETEK